MALVQAARIERAEKRAIERVDLRHAAHFALEHISVVAVTALPARFHLFRNVVETFRNSVGIAASALSLDGVARIRCIEHAADGALLDDIAIVARMQTVDTAADLTRLLDDIAQIAPGTLDAVARYQHSVDKPLINQIIFERSLILEIGMRLAARDFVERRLRDVDVALFDELRSSAGRRTSTAACECARRRRRRRS